MPKKTTKQRVKSYCSQCYVPTCDIRGPCRFPHGCCYSTLAIVSAIGGLLMNCYVIGSCFFMRVTLINPVNGDVIPGSERGYGFLSREADYGIMPDYKECVYYPQAEYELIFDGWMHIGRLFAFFSAILAAVCFLVLFFTCCCAFSPSMFERWLFWMYIAAAICIALSMFAYGCEWCSESECTVADGTGWAISAFMFHLVSANTVKSFAAAGAPTNNNPEDDPFTNDDDLDDLYYDREEDKYPPPDPRGPRGIVVRKNGKSEFDSGEDYYDDMGRMHNPYGDGDDRHGYRGTRKFDTIASEDIIEAELDDISDHDLDQYASDSDDEEDVAPKFDAMGNRIYDPKKDKKGNLGVGYEEEHAQFDEFGNPLGSQYVDYTDGQQPYHNNPATNSTPTTQLKYDEYGNPSAPQSAPPGNLGVGYEEEHVQFDEFGNPLGPPYGKPFDNDNPLSLASVREEGEYDELQKSQSSPTKTNDPDPNQGSTSSNFGDVLGTPPRHQAYDEYGNPIVTKDRDKDDNDDDGRVFA